MFYKMRTTIFRRLDKKLEVHPPSVIGPLFLLGPCDGTQLPSPGAGGHYRSSTSARGDSPSLPGNQVTEDCPCNVL